LGSTEESFLDKYFALDDIRQMGEKEGWRECAALPGRGSEDCKLRTGEGYSIYAGRDVLGTLCEEMEIVCGRVCRWIGVKEEYVYGVVERFERRVYN
jgi:hypothetical protein